MTGQDQQQQDRAVESLRKHLLRRHSHNRAQRSRVGQVTPNATAVRLGRYLRAARVNAGLSSGELARQAGLPAGTILALEQGLVAAENVKPAWLARLARALDEDVGTFALLLDFQPACATSRWQPLSALWAWFSTHQLPGPAYGAVSATLLCVLVSAAIFLSVELPYPRPGEPQSLPADTAEADVSGPVMNLRLVEPSSIFPEERLSLLKAERIKIAAPIETAAQPAALPHIPVIEHQPVDRAFLLSKLEPILASPTPEESVVYSDFVLLASPEERLEGRPNVTNAEFRLENQVLILPKVININSEIRQNMLKAETRL